MDKKFIAHELRRTAKVLDIIAAKAEVPNYIWESLKKIYGEKRWSPAQIAKGMLKIDADDKPVVLTHTIEKCKAIAIGARSIEKKAEDLGHPEIKLGTEPFDDNAEKLGIPKEEYTKYIEPPENIIGDIIKANAGEEVTYKRRSKGEASSNVNMEEVEKHKAFKEFKEKFVDVLGNVTYKVTKSNENINVFEDTVVAKIDSFDIKITFFLMSKGEVAEFRLLDWEGPTIESDIRYQQNYKTDQFSVIANDIKNAKFKGAIYTKDGRNVLTLNEDEIRQYFTDENVDLNKRIEILKAKKKTSGKKKEYSNLVTMVFDSFPKDGDSENGVIKNTPEAAQFLADFSDVINWNYVTRYIKLPEELMLGFIDRLDFDWISSNPELSTEFIDKLGDKEENKDKLEKLNWKWISSRGDLSDEFIKKFAKYLDLNTVMSKQTLSRSLVNYLKKNNLLPSK